MDQDKHARAVFRLECLKLASATFQKDGVDDHKFIIDRAKVYELYLYEDGETSTASKSNPKK